jgi:hypothetical protein
MQSGGKSVLLNNEQLTGRREMTRSRRRENSESGLCVSWLRRHGTMGSVQSRTGPLRRYGPRIGIVTVTIPRFSGRVQKRSGFFQTLGLRHTYER